MTSRKSCLSLFIAALAVSMAACSATESVSGSGESGSEQSSQSASSQAASASDDRGTGTASATSAEPGGTEVADAESNADAAPSDAAGGEGGDGTESASGDAGPVVEDDAGTVDEEEGTPMGDFDPMATGSGYASDEVMIKLVSPGGGMHASVIGSKTTVGGILFGYADKITWISSGGQTGEIAPSPFWTSGPIDLTVGDNKVTVSAFEGTESVSDEITITYNPVFQFDDKPVARPDVVWKGTSTSVVFTIPVSLYPNFDPNTVTLLKVDEQGQTLMNLGQMVDNGATSSTGDEIDGDGVFTKKATISCSEEGRIFYRASVQVKQGTSNYTALSDIIAVHCVEHLSPSDCSSYQAILNKADADALAGMGVEDIVSELMTNAQVKDAGRAEGDGHSIWVQFQSGVLGAVLLAPPGMRGGGLPYDPPMTGQFNPMAALTGAVDIGSKQAIVLAPFASEFAATEDGTEVANVLASSECPSFTLAGGSALQASMASLERFRALNIYGVISISSHGEALFGNLNTDDKRELYHWAHSGSQEVVWSGEALQCGQLLQSNQACTVSGDNPNGGCPTGTYCLVTGADASGDFATGTGLCLDRTQVDLRLGNVVMTNKGYAMTPGFFARYAGRGYPNSLVNIGSCRSIYNGTLVASFFANGAKAITGFSDYVDSAWAKERVVELFVDSVGSGGLLGHAHQGGQDPSNPGTYWRLFGAGNLDLSNAEIINASFETGDTTGWTREGDGRVVTQLGATGPVAGKFMGLLSTGLGFTVQTGTLEQDFCIPEDKTEMQIYWKFFSEEFKEYCGSQYQDTFQAVLVSGGYQLTVVDVKVDDLCFYSDGSCSSCTAPNTCGFECMGDQSGGCTYNEQSATCSGAYNCQCGKFFVGLTPSDVVFDQGGVFNTLWQETVKNITAMAGEKVKLRLYTSDAGDSIFDTVLLVDHLNFK